jgi:hypothetical protein
MADMANYTYDEEVMLSPEEQRKILDNFAHHLTHSMDTALRARFDWIDCGRAYERICDSYDDVSSNKIFPAEIRAVADEIYETMSQGDPEYRIYDLIDRYLSLI